MPTPTITLLIKGLVAIFVNEAETECTVGILKDPPPRHDLMIIFSRGPVGGALEEFKVLNRPQIKDTLRLDVQNTSEPKLTFRKKNIVINREVDPVGDADKDSFEWFVDLENEELYDHEIGASKDGFKQILTFNKGELFTAETSSNPLLIQRGSFGEYEPFGFVAITIGVKISLDQANSSAAFLNGGTDVLGYKPNTDYQIAIIHERMDQHPMLVNDANHYYKAVGSGVPVAERFLFLSINEEAVLKAMRERNREDRDEKDAKEEAMVDDYLRAGPEAACFSAYFSDSNLT
jgi:hypothetical protein